jgi:hypothetical protein
MTMPNERTRAVIWALEFLHRLSNPYGENGIKKIPVKVRREARDILRHFPYPQELKYPEHFDDDVIEEYYLKLEEEWEAARINTKSADN